MPDAVIGKGINKFFNNFMGILLLRGVNLILGKVIRLFFKVRSPAFIF